MLARLARDPHSRCPRPDQITHRLMCQEDTIVAHLSKLPVQAIAAMPCFRAKTQPATFNG